ncbi:unnamed protein product, partial [Staurois parvus]
HRRWRLQPLITRSQTVIPCRHLAIAEYHLWGRGLYVNNTDLSPVSSSKLPCIALHSRATVKHTQSTQ